MSSKPEKRAARQPLKFGVDVLAAEYVLQQNVVRYQQKKLDRLREKLIALVREGGSVPARATKTIALAGILYEARVTEPVEVTVDTGVADKIRDACARDFRTGLFRKLFRRIETFVLADGAHDVINQPRLPKGAPRNLRALFGRAVKVRALGPQLEVREIEKEKS